jgi:hypothetical protein
MQKVAEVVDSKEGFLENRISDNIQPIKEVYQKQCNTGMINSLEKQHFDATQQALNYVRA